MRYLECDNCKGRYELKNGESPDDFESCECGGKLRYFISPNSDNNEIKPGKNVKTFHDGPKTVTSQDKSGPKPKRKKYLILSLLAVVLVVSVIGGYYAYGAYQENQYYENYRLQSFNAFQGQQKYNYSMNSLSGYNIDTMTDAQFIQQSPDMISKLDQGLQDMDTAINYEEKAHNYDAEMLKFADTPDKKAYAESLFNQTNKTISYYNLSKQKLNILKSIIEAGQNNDSNRITELSNQLTELNKQINSLYNEIDALARAREDLRANNPNFVSRLDKEYEIAKNATLK